MANTVKIVINRCYGGYGLSDAARALLAVRKGYTQRIDDEKSGEWFANPEGERISGYALERDTPRTDADLVEVVELMGSAANCKYANLEVLILQKGERYYIDEYDGVERIVRESEMEVA